jgi:hypothetical protein
MTYEELKENISAEISLDEFGLLEVAYMALPFDKDQFCAIVDALGAQALIDRLPQFERINTAKDELFALESYRSARAAIASIDEQLRVFHESIDACEAEKAAYLEGVRRYKEMILSES